MFQVEMVTKIKVKADHLKSAVEIPTRVEDGVHYIKISKSGWLARLLCKDGSSLEKALTGSELISTITQLRDKQYRAKISFQPNRHMNSARMAQKLIVEGSPSEVITPTIAGIEGLAIPVLLDPQKSAAWVSADPAVLEYLYKIINEEREHCMPNEPVAHRDKAPTSLELPAGMHEIKSGPHKGFVRVSRDEATDELVTPKKAKKYRYVKIDVEDPGKTIDHALTWRDAAAVDGVSDDDADHGVANDDRDA